MSVEGHKTLDQDIFGLAVALFLAGCALYYGLHDEPPFEIIWGLPFFVPFLWLSRQFNRRFYLLILFTAFYSGLSWPILYTSATHQPVLEHNIGPIDLWGRIERIEDGDKRIRYVLSHVQYDPIPAQTMPAHIRISAPYSSDRVREGALEIGDEIWLNARLTPLSSPMYPGGFDFGRQLYFQGIGAQGYSYTPAELDLHIADPTLKQRFERLRRIIGHHIDAAMEPRLAAISKALLVGERSGVDENTYQQIREAGLAHIMAISGLHMGMVTGLIYAVMRFLLLRSTALSLRYSIKKIAAFIAICGGCFYLLMSGAGTSSLRSFIMVCVFFAAIIFDRAAFSYRSIAVAAFLVLLISPYSVASAGFQMSFAAVLSLVFVYQSMTGLSPWLKQRMPHRLAVLCHGVIGLAVTATVASVAVFPIAAYHFQEAHLAGLFANMIVVPLMGLWVMPAGLLGIIVTPFGLEAVPLGLMGQGVDVILAVAQYHSTHIGGSWLTGAVPKSAFLIYSFGLMSLMFKPSKLKGVIPVFCIAASLYLHMKHEQPDIIISGEKDVAIYHGEKGGYLSTSKSKGRFEQDIWLKALGRDHADKDIGEAVCQQKECQLIAHAKDGGKWRVSWMQSDLQSYGVITIKLGDVPKLDSVRDHQGQRPWNIPFYEPLLPLPIRIVPLNSGE